MTVATTKNKAVQTARASYDDFISGKVKGAHQHGFDVALSDIHPALFDWQAHIVQWALRLGKAALFEECGAGKTLQQLEWAKRVQAHTGGRVLITAPLAVAGQTIREAQKIDLEVSYVRGQEEAKRPGVYITNYDMLQAFHGPAWDGIVNDESSILKNFTGATKRLILEMFRATPYKLACTATPAPNDHLELGNHAEHLNVMASNEMIQRWFINDTMQAGNYRLKKWSEGEFWKWVTTWAVCLSTPSDIGYPDETDRYSFDMPELVIHNETVKVDHSRAWNDGRLIVDGTLSATSMWKEKAATLEDRCNRAREIVDNSTDPWLIWCDTDSEADRLKALFPDALEVRGSQPRQEKERKLLAFADGQAQILITKPDIAGYGLNFQHCHDQIFVGVTYSFERTHQALRRSWRFGQTHDVHAWMIAAESEGDIVKNLQTKQAAHKQMQQAMNRAMRENGFSRKTERHEATIHERGTAMIIPAWLETQTQGA